MKKLLSAILTILVILPAFFSFTQTAKADDPTINGIVVQMDGSVAITPKADTTRVFGALTTTITGTLTKEGKDNLPTGSPLIIRYQKVSSGTDTSPAFIQRWYWANNYSTSYCRVDRSSSDYSFKCPIEGLEYGGYVFKIGLLGYFKVMAPFMQTAAFNVVNTHLIPPDTTLNIENFTGQVMNGNSVKITGKASPDLIKQTQSAPGLFNILWGAQKSLPEDKVRIADLSKEVSLKSSFKDGSFNITIPNLDIGTYVFAVEQYDTKLHKPFLLSTFIEVPVSGQSSQNQYKLTDPVSTGGFQEDLANGYWADPEVTIDKPDAGYYKLELGYASAVASGDVHYTCALNGEAEPKMLGPAVNVTANSDKASIRNVGKFKSLKPGLYCAGLRYSLINDDPMNPSYHAKFLPLDVGGQNVKFFLVTSAGKPGIFSVGGEPIPPGATLDPLANGTGCSTGTDNSTYCLLAPLPGVGDATGKLDVATGMGDYINAIIKLLMGLIGVLSVLMIVIGGIEYMSTVSLGEKEGARERITNALFGLLLTLSAYLILYTINPNLVNLTVTVPRENIQVAEMSSDIGLPFDPGAAGLSSGTELGSSSGPNDVAKIGPITKYDANFQSAATKFGVDCTWLKATMYRESGGNPFRPSPAGAVGLMQMMPGTWADNGFPDASKWTDIQYSIDASATYMKKLKTTGCNQSPTNSASGCNVTNNNYINGYMAAAYNGGSGVNAPAVDCTGKTKWECKINQGGLKETDKYARYVLNNYERLKATGGGC